MKVSLKIGLTNWAGYEKSGSVIADKNIFALYKGSIGKVYGMEIESSKVQ